MIHGSRTAAWSRASVFDVKAPASCSGAKIATAVMTPRGKASPTAHVLTSRVNREAAWAATNRGSTTTRSELATRARVRYAPYAAKKPSVFTPCPNFRERMTPSTAADALTAAVETPVRSPLRTAPAPLDRLPSIRARRRYIHLVGRRTRRSEGG